MPPITAVVGDQPPPNGLIGQQCDNCLKQPIMCQFKVCFFRMQIRSLVDFKKTKKMLHRSIVVLLHFCENTRKHKYSFATLPHGYIHSRKF